MARPSPGADRLETDAALLRVDSLSAAYGRVRVLWDITFHVKPEEIVCLVGANGAGKTTLLRAVSGLLRPAGRDPAGTVVFNNRAIGGRGAAVIARMGIAHVPEGRHLFPAMSVTEHLELGAAFVPRAWERRADTMAEVFGLFPRLRERLPQLAGTMSGGEQQMLAIARALMARPKMLLVDEPSMGLAPVLVQAVFEALRTINRQGVTVLLVEQNVRQTLLMANRGYVLENGRIVLEGTGRELLTNAHVKAAYLGL
jgi:branched-chain amino acid transport system ATP-binding protein